MLRRRGCPFVMIVRYAGVLRWTMAAPSCFVIEIRGNLENELGADIEQCPPKVLALGLDHEDAHSLL